MTENKYDNGIDEYLNHRLDCPTTWDEEDICSCGLDGEKEILKRFIEGLNDGIREEQRTIRGLVEKIEKKEKEIQ